MTDIERVFERIVLSSTPASSCFCASGDPFVFRLRAICQMKDTGLNDTHPVELVRESYLESFRELQETQKPHDRHSVAAFTETVQRAHKRGENTVVLMACGLQDLTRDAGGSGERNELEHGEGPLGSHDEAHLKRVQDFLDNFYQVCNLKGCTSRGFIFFCNAVILPTCLAAADGWLATLTRAG